MRKPDKQRFIDAVNHIQVDQVPFYEAEVDIAIVSKLMGRELDMSLHSFELPVADVVQFNRIIGNDMIYFSHVWHLGRKEKRDSEGRVHYVDGFMKTPESLKDITYPDVDRHKERLEELLETIESSGFGVICGAQTAGFTVPTAIGYEDFCINTITNPGFIADFQERVHDYSMRELEMLLQYPIDGVKIASGLITNSGPMISPQMLEEFEFKYIQQQVDLIKASGKTVIFHIDGYIVDLLDRFIEMGADVINPIDPSCLGQDIFQIKKDYGDRIALNGNIDINGVLLHGSPEQVKEDVLRHLEELSIGGGYIVASSHDLHQLLPLENILAMTEAVHSFRSRL